MTMAGGTTHVVFGDTQGDLAHGSDDPFPFSIETVDERRGYSVRAGLEAEIAASADGALHVAYFVAPEVGPWPSAYELWYATNESGAWTTELLDTAGIPNAAITVDGDVVHVSYFDESNVDLRYARREAGVWTLETVEPGSGSFGANRTSIGASDGAVTIAYPEPADPSHVRLATKDGAVWTRRTLDVRGAFAMAMDGGATYVVAVERGGVALYTDLRGGFDREEVADDSEGASDLAIAIGEGDLHVAFQTGIGESLRYATRQKPDGVDRDCDGRD
jgi:hypothetical protein